MEGAEVLKVGLGAVLESGLEKKLPVLLAGATASGKSDLGLRLARQSGGIIINADALQVYSDWRILTARPSEAEAAECPHELYGYVGLRQPYSVGHWLADVREVLANAEGRQVIILGGTGLYFNALTRGLSDIPAIPDSVKAQADALAEREGLGVFADILREQDPASYARLDAKNPARTRRAWEVLASTGKGLAAHHSEGAQPLLPTGSFTGVVLSPDLETLHQRIDSRFDKMIDAGAIAECEAVLASGEWDASLPSCQAIGAKELIAHIRGECTLELAIEQAKTRTRQFAKRQRTWFRNQLDNWHVMGD